MVYFASPMYVYFSALALALFVFLQPAIFPNRKHRIALSVLTLAGSLAMRNLAPFSPLAYLFYLAVGAVAWGLVVLVWRKESVLRHVWPALDVLGVGAFFAASLSAIGIVVLAGGVKARLTLLAIYLATAASIHLWHELQCSHILNRPSGLPLAQALILTGALALVFGGTRFDLLAVALLAVGLVLLGLRLRTYFEAGKERRAAQQLALLGDHLQPEATPASFECPVPGRWSMYDLMTAEKEVLDLLYALVRAAKPGLTVETGTYSGISTLYIARALQDNGSGSLITCEMDPVVHRNACDRFAAAGLGSFIDCRLSSSFDLKVNGAIDFFYSDSALSVREEEVRRFLPRISPQGLILMHDAGSHFGVVREGAMRMEQEGLISVVMVSTPRGLVVAQKREGRR